MTMTLKAARVNQNLTQIEAAKKLGVSRDTLWNYENGRSYPNVQIIKKMEKLYKLSYDDINFLPENND